MFGPRIQQHARRIAEMIVQPLAKLGLTPNMATVLGLLLNAATAVVFALGYLRPGGILLLFAGMFDMVDGALARVRNQKTIFGAFFDSTLDRYSEGLVLLGIILFASTSTSASYRTWTIALAYAAGLGSLMVSYARARAEGLGLELKSGLMARPERVLLLAAGLIIGGEAWLPWTLLILAITSVFTSVQRIVVVWLKLRDGEPGVESATNSPAGTTGRAGQDGDTSVDADNGTKRRRESSAPSITSERSTQR